MYDAHNAKVFKQSHVSTIACKVDSASVGFVVPFKICYAQWLLSIRQSTVLGRREMCGTTTCKATRTTHE